MSTITLYAGKANSMSGMINDIKKSVKDYKLSLDSLKNKINKIDSSVCNVEEVISSLKASAKTQEEKIEKLDVLKEEVDDFVSDVVRIDGEVADVIDESKDDFYEEYSHLKPECEKNAWDKFKEGCKKVGEWCKEHWKAIVTVAIVIAAVVCLFIPGVNAAIAGLALGKIILGAAAGALIGAISGGLIGGITSALSGGSFWEGVEDGAFSGTISGMISGGLSGAGSILGSVSNSCKLFKVMKHTSRISGVLSKGMSLFDVSALVVSLFDSQNAFVQFNQDLHKNKFYEAFQFTVGAISDFSSGTYEAMSTHTDTLTCFVAGTLIMTANGRIAIENIKVGDKVISTNPETFETAEKTVLETYIREDSKLIHLVIKGEEIVTTETHPFYVKDKGFVNAGELKVGDKLLDIDGNILLLEKFDVELTDEPTTVYNFQVEDFHTYHVGEFGVWVHNSNCKLIRNDDGTYDAELSYKEDWTPEQRAEADAKCKALSKADTAKTIPERGSTSASKEYKNEYGENSVLKTQDVDHTIDLQLGGIDDIHNMNPLDKSVNRSLGSQIAYLIKNLDYGTVLRNFKMVDQKNL